MKEYTYDAFISYRHLPAEIAAADKLQKLLERHKKKNGKKLRIFRDRTELPTSSDLGNQIQKALEESRFLILICSPAYLQSKWCMEELRYFRQLHGQRNVNILPLLLEGEPADVFPREICHELRQIPDENGMIRMVRVEIEPLGADIRAASLRKQLKKLRTEYLRIAAPLLDVSFDSLYQRTKRRQIITTAAVSAAVVLAATAFAIYNVHMIRQIDQAHQTMLARESLRLATESQEVLQAGEIPLATLLAMEALPDDLTDPERPLTPESETALRSAVYTHMSQAQYAPVRLITSVEFNSISWGFLGTFRQGSIFAVTDQELIYFYDSATGALLYSCPGNYNECYILNDGALVVFLEIESFGKSTHSAAIYDVNARRQVYQREFRLEDMYPELWCLPGSDTLYFTASGWDENDQPTTVLLEAVNPDGTAAAEQVLPPEELLQLPDICMIYEDSPYLESENDYYWMTGSDHEPGPSSPQGEQYLDLIQQLWKEDYSSAIITQAEDLLIFDTRGVDTVNVIYSMAQLEQGVYDPVEVSGTLYVDSVNKRFYCDTGSAMQVYDYDLTKFAEPKSATLVSPDGSRYAIGAAIYNKDDLSTPLLDPQCKEDFALYHITPDLEYVFHQTPEDILQLWSVSQGLVMELVPNEDNNKNVVALTVNQDGSLVAMAHHDHTVEVYNRDSEFIASFTFPDEVWHVEFEGSRLLIAGMWSSWIVDVYEPDDILEIPRGTDSTYPTDQYLTGDNLYICTGEYFEYAMDAVYDLETGECIFQERGYYQYNEANGILLYIPADPRFGGNPLLHAAMRGEDGMFRDIYTIKTQGFDMVLPRTPSGAGEQYFLLLDTSCCQIYASATGELVYTMYFGSGQETYQLVNTFFIQNDILYDLRFYEGGSPAAYPMLELADALRRTDAYLTSPLATRELSAQEKAAYFIEN